MVAVQISRFAQVKSASQIDFWLPLVAHLIRLAENWPQFWVAPAFCQRTTTRSGTHIPVVQRDYRPLLCFVLAGFIVADVSPVLAQAVSFQGTPVNITPGQATCNAPICFEAYNAGSILNSNGNAINVTVPSDPGNFPTNTGVYAHDAGTINLNDGGLIAVGQDSQGLFAGSATGPGTINATGLTISGSNSRSLIGLEGVGSVVTLNDTTMLTGTISQYALFSYGGAMTFNGPVQANGEWGTFAISNAVSANGSGRIDFNRGGTVIGTGNTIEFFRADWGGIDTSVPGGTITMTDLTVQATTNTPFTTILSVVNGGTIAVTNSTLTGSNAGGSIYGISMAWVTSGTGVAGHVSLDNSQLTMQSPGSAILVQGMPTATVTLTNGSAITGFGNGNDSLARITVDSVAGVLTLNATDSTLVGNILLTSDQVITNTDSNTINLNLAGTSTWTGDVTAEPGNNGLPTQANIVLAGAARWTGAANNATNINVGSGTIWTMTADSSVIQAFDSNITPINGNVVNGGTIAFAADGPFKTLNTYNYAGQGGTLVLNTQLGTDGSASDQLIINGGTANGRTNVLVNNKGGAGAPTTNNGIPIVVATGGATTTSDAFRLGGPVYAGLAQYQLFRGPETTGTLDEQNSWYLRSHLHDGPNPPIPIYHPEGAMFASMPSLGRELTRNTIGTFHDYNGDQGLLRGNGAPGRAWGRVFGEAIEQGHAGLLSPSFKGKAYGFQTGADLFESETPSGFKDRFGVFFSYAKAKGEVRGFALGIQNNYVGDSSLEGLSGGAYWTRVGPRDEYLEARVLGTRYTGDGTSFANNINIDVKGTSFAASLEGGYPIRFGSYTIEPQAQLIYQYLDMTGSDPQAHIAYDTPDALYARAGVRVSSDGLFGWSNVRPYLKANVWQDMVGTDKAIFSATDVVGTSFRTTALEVGGGVVAQLTQHVGLWGMMDYTTDISGSQDREIIRGNVGMRVVW